jgi:O-6-methylguanine DNA methyltransferase
VSAIALFCKKVGHKMRKENSSKRISEFYNKVYNVVRTIPRGKTMTYGEVARAVGKPGAARAVGNALNKNRDPKIPCHRVIRFDGNIGGYNKGTKLKIRLLKSEGAIK